MSADKPSNWKSISITAAVTLLFVVASYFVWSEGNQLARKFAGGTVLADLRFLFGFLAVFLFLSLAQALMSRFLK
ncbi:hypothetical protein JM93_02695 [Roseibium hamelinense]|uniref:Uncharacterized protein n=1 Tax=Roseibium hamelinense TaxID=150831 RepID=A0A562SYD1_9HYPH|nr:hypothetical protein [Roseibium hamelinense]MTI44820.1 hypothetical protein [Roseibium hamelinense]TWI85988.1 hypothetical protein JM93_02695 [Roseibium hamelinense]